MRPARRWLWVGVAAALVGLAVWQVSARRADPPQEVRWVTLEPGLLEDVISAPGKVAARQRRDVVARIDGLVVAAPVDVGDPVKAGQVMFRLDDADRRARLAEARAAYQAALQQAQQELLTARSRVEQLEARVAALRSELERAEADWQRAEEERGRAERLVAAGAWASGQLAAARTTAAMALATRDRVASELRGATADLEAARRQLALLRQGVPATAPDQEAVARAPQAQQAAAVVARLEEELSATVVRAPLAGLVVAREVQAGQAVTAGTVLATVVDPQSLVVEADVDEIHVGKLAVGQRAEVVSDAFPGLRLRGKVQAIAPLVRKAENLQAVQVRVAPADPREFARLRVGMTVTARIAVARREGVLSVPLEALLEPAAQATGGQRSVWVVEADGPSWRVHRRPIRTGLVTVRAAEVLEGLRAGERVVVAGLEGLQEGQRVKAAQVTSSGQAAGRGE